MRGEVYVIQELLRKNRKYLKNTKVFIFGSLVKNEKYINDIDLLIICNDLKQSKIIRKILENFSFLPVDLLFLSYEEEIELNFIKAQNCKLLYAHSRSEVNIAKI